MPTINSIDSNIPIEIAKGGTNATSMSNTDGVCFFDGTRVVTTSVGSPGQVLASNGSGNAPTFQSVGSNNYVANIKLTASQVKNSHGTPIQLIPAPGANKVICIVNSVARLAYGGTSPFIAANSQSIFSYWSNPPVTYAGGGIVAAGISSTADFYELASYEILTDGGAGIFDNKPIMLWNSVATEISGNALNDNYIYISVFYFISDLSY